MTHSIKKLPKKVEQHVNQNTAFNMFGLCNLSTLRASTNTRLSKDELIKRINYRFANEMNGNIEFTGS